MNQVDPKWLKRGLVAAWANGEQFYPREARMGDEELKAIEERAARVPDGPWYVEERAELFDDDAPELGHIAVYAVTVDTHIASEHKRDVVAVVDSHSAYYAFEKGQERAIVEFIAAARTDIPALVVEVRRLRAALGTREP
jgi:hypothetical protein